MTGHDRIGLNRDHPVFAFGRTVAADPDPITPIPGTAGLQAQRSRLCESHQLDARRRVQYAAAP